MLYFLFNELFLLLTQIHLIHFHHELVPRLLLLNFFVFLPGILRLDVSFDTLSSLSSTISWLDLLAGGRRLLLSSLRLLLLRLAGMSIEK